MRAVFNSSPIIFLTKLGIIGAVKCDRYKKTHFHKFHGGHNCGICTQACPVGQKVLRK